MKYILLCCALLCVAVSFSQSKKKQIQDLNRKIDSLELMVSSYSTTLDSCAQNAIVQNVTIENKERENIVIRDIMKGYVRTIDELNSRLIEFEISSSENSDKKVSGVQKKSPKHEIVVKDEDIPLFFRNGSGTGESRSGDFERRRVKRNSESSLGFESGVVINDSRVYDNQLQEEGLSEDENERMNVARSYEPFPNNDRRIRLNNVKISDIDLKNDVSIYYKLTIDSNGNVVAYTLVKSNLASANLELVKIVGDAIKKQVRYNKVVGAPNSFVYYHVDLKMN